MMSREKPQVPRSEVIKDCAEIKPAPARDLQVSEVGLPQLVDGCGFVLELVSGFHHDKGRTGN